MSLFRERQCLTGPATGQPIPVTLETLIFAVPVWTFSGHSQGPKYCHPLWKGNILGMCGLANALCICSRKAVAFNAVINVTLETEWDAQSASSNDYVITEVSDVNLSFHCCLQEADIESCRGLYLLCSYVVLNCGSSWSKRSEGSGAKLRACEQMHSSCHLPLTVSTM